MLKPVIAIIMVIILVVAAIAPVQAQPACGKRSEIVLELQKGFGERREGAGVSGSWTILKTTTEGIKCLMAVGLNWRDDPPVFTPATVGH
jgi:hypothetical protein